MRNYDCGVISDYAGDILDRTAELERLHGKQKGDGYMYINPFWAGVIATITFELLMFVFYVIYTAIKSPKDKKNQK